MADQLLVSTRKGLFSARRRRKLIGPSEILRQQFTFSPPGTTLEVEDYVVNLQGVTVLELRIVPDISRGDARASLNLLRLA